ncbi:MAG: Asp-tRNA(Asn)/Glu-tRNA(Gln) amidotransferase subunit GatB [Deltaproteobacteria bacterium]|nr:Asp-tRNA(Asn)/Glu-tRNA(Gln) amidotransferase subunit GatB [Deltaproteobacteria bacterium]
MDFEPVIGLEVHAQLATHSKIFCRCSTEFGKEPNHNTCPVCLGLPGALPVINRRAVEFAVMLGLATNCEIRLDSQFARKNYFYPDLPKSYQISQFDRPLCEHGWVDIEVKGETKRIGITRIHMEEDAGKLIHEGEDPNASYVDLNRAGIPLVEIVSEPDIRTSEEAKAYMEKIHSIVTYLEICNGDMEKGNLRCDANVSIRPNDKAPFGTRTETKNLNSFRHVQACIDYEIGRQIDVTLDGGKIIQQTRLWDANKKQSKAMRDKEDSHDYRYFPCPDLPVVDIDQNLIISLREKLPELPDDKKARFQEDYSLGHYDASVLVVSKEMANYFEETVKNGATAKTASNWITGDLSRFLNETKTSITESKVTPERLTGLIKLIEDGTISGKIAKSVFETMFETGKEALEIVENQGLKQVSDETQLREICDEIVRASPSQVQEYKAGKQKVFGFFVGQAMKQTKGQANPQVINQILKELLS